MPLLRALLQLVASPSLDGALDDRPRSNTHVTQIIFTE